MTPDLITGATGFIGRHLARRLIEQGRPLRLLCRRGSEAKLPEEVRANVEIVHVDLAALSRADERERLNHSVRGISRVFHCAGHVSDWGSERQFHGLNVEATRALLDACAQDDSGAPAIQRFVHLSSIAAFGTPSPPYFDDETPLGHGRDAYSRTKAEGESVAFAYHCERRLPVTVIRPAVVYGLDGSWLEEPLRMIESGKMFLLGGGRGTCHPCYIENLVDAILLAAEHSRSIGQAYIVGDDDPVSFRDYFDSLAWIVGKDPIRRSIPLFAARAMAGGFELGARLVHSSRRPLLTRAALDMVSTQSTMSMKKIREELGFKPRYSFRAAISELREGYRGRLG